MPKPVKKAAPKRRPASDPNRRAHQMLDEHLAELDQGKWKDAPTPDVTPPHGDPFEEQYRKRMSDLGRKGGKVSGAKRMENLTPKQRKEIAKKAAAARWSDRPNVRGR
jgi:general stress protein YciG